MDNGNDKALAFVTLVKALGSDLFCPSVLLRICFCCSFLSFASTLQAICKACIIKGWGGRGRTRSRPSVFSSFCWWHSYIFPAGSWNKPELMQGHMKMDKAEAPSLVSQGSEENRKQSRYPNTTLHCSFHWEVKCCSSSSHPQLRSDWLEVGGTTKK